MRGFATLLMLSALSTSTACTEKDSRSTSAGSASTGSASASPSADKPGSAATGSLGGASNPAGSAGSRAPSGSADPKAEPATGSDGSDEVARLVVRDVGSKALGNQKIDASCVSVVVMPAGTWTVAAAWLKGCGDKTARSILWLYKRSGNGPWNEDYVGQPPRCWKGVPPDIAEAVTKATKIPSC